MKKRILYSIWGCLYIFCAALGYAVTEPTQLQAFALLVLSLLFFAPPALLLVDAYRHGCKQTRITLRWISGASLALTFIFLIANIASALGGAALGNALYEILILVSVPMICSQQWFLSIFLWACVFFATLGRKQKQRAK